MRRGLGVATLLLFLGCAAEPPQRPPSPIAPTPTPSATATPEIRERFAHAVALVQAGKEARARPILASLRSTNPVLEDYYLHFLALVDQRAGRASASATADDQLLGEYPESVWIPHALARQAARALDRGTPDVAVLIERSLAHPDADADSRALALFVRANQRAGTRPREAYRLFHRVRRLGGWAAEPARAGTRALEAAHPSLLADVKLQLAEAALRAAEGQRDLAAERLEDLARLTPAHDRLRVLLDLARTLKLAERYDEALAVLRRAVALDPSRTNPARLQLAYRLWSQDHDAEAQAMFETFLQESPRHPARVSMRYAIGRIAEERGDLTEALRRYRQVAASGDRKLAREARWRLGWAPYRRGDLATAAEGFRAVEQRGAADRTEAIYWQARIRERRRDLAAATPLYDTVLKQSPHGYYGSLVERRLDRPPTLAAPAETVPLPAGTRTADDGHWHRRTALLDAGLEPLAAREVTAWVRHLPASAQRDASVLEAYASVGAHSRARKLAHRLASHGTITTATRLRYDYPKAYWRHITGVAAELALDPFLIVSIMRQESLFDAEAISPVGARGLMQLMPNTARRIAGSPVDLRALADPATNITLAARYLRQLLDRYEGRVAWAVAAYNAGEHAVDKWVAREGDVEPDEFVESISYRETRKYAKAVLANLRRYRQLYSR